MFGCMKKAAVHVSNYHPFFVEFMYSLKFIEDERVGTAGINGSVLRMNPKYIATLTERQKVTALLHELCHKMMLHMYRRGNRHPRGWNYAADFAINLLLTDMQQEPIPGWLHDEKYRGMSAEEIYEQLMNDKKMRKLIEEPSIFDDLLEPENMEQGEREARHVLARAVANAKAFGNMPGPLEKFVAQALEDSKEPWFNHLRRYMQQTVNTDYSWKRANRRVMYTQKLFAPTPESEGLESIAVLIDTSGSCFEVAQQNDFCSHLNSILTECRPRKVNVWYFDTEITGHESFDGGATNVQLSVVGGGGTCFETIFDHITEEAGAPDVAIVLTDLHGPTGKEPDFPVVWAVTSSEQGPFGQTIRIGD